MEPPRPTLNFRPRLAAALGSILLSLVCISITLPAAALFILVKDDSVVLTIVLRVIAVVLFLEGVYFLLIMFYNAARIEVGPTLVRLRLPRTRGMFVLPSLIRAEIAYDAITAIETREEVYISFGLGNVERAYSLVTRDGTRIPLGIAASYRTPQLAYAEAAAEIAARAGTAVINRGAVGMGGVFSSLWRGAPPWTTDSMLPEEVAKTENRTRLVLTIVSSFLFLLFAMRACGSL